MTGGRKAHSGRRPGPSPCPSSRPPGTDPRSIPPLDLVDRPPVRPAVPDRPARPGLAGGPGAGGPLCHPVDGPRVLGSSFAWYRPAQRRSNTLSRRFHGAERPTKDIDLVPKSSGENLDRLAGALGEVGAYLRVEGLTDDEARALPVQLDAAALDRMEVSTWRTDAGDLDVLIGLRSAAGERVSYDELEQRSVETTLGAVTIRLADSPASSSRRDSRTGRRTVKRSQKFRNCCARTSRPSGLHRGQAISIAHRTTCVSAGGVPPPTPQTRRSGGSASG
jgi:hypothetical protein